MSVLVMGHVWKYSEQTGGNLLILLGLADYADDDGRCWPKVDSLATKARLSSRQTARVLRELVDAGELEMPDGQRSKESPFLVRLTNCPCHPRQVEADVGDGADLTLASGSHVEPPSPPEEPPLFEQPSVIDEVFDLYRGRVPGKQGSRLTRETRKLIEKALDERPPEKLKAAIIGLSMSDHHRDGGWLALKYAIGRVKVGESVGDRIDMMAAKAPHGAIAVADTGQITVTELLKPYTGYNHQLVLGKMHDVRRGLLEPSAHNERIAVEAEAFLREKAQIVVVRREGRKIVWGRA